jgi:hypothetical protein
MGNDSNEHQSGTANVAPKPTVTAPTPTVPATPAVAGLMLPADQTQALLNILIQQQARLALKDQQEEEAKAARNKQREKNSADHTAKDLLRQSRCSHLKGGRKGPRSQVRDYAVYLHTYIDSSYVIRCFLCKMVWKVNDTAEFLMRKGKKIANHTKIGWFEATKMLEQTTNTPSSSEVPAQQIAIARPDED